MQHLHPSSSSSLAAHPIVPPLALLAVEGLYDLPALIAYHADTPAYRDLVTNAFGSNPEVWAAASPALGLSSSSSSASHPQLPQPKLIALAHSRQDELVEWQQVDLMHAALKKAGGFDEVEGEAGRRLKLIELNGGHDDVWREGGGELARAVSEVLQVVRGMG